MDKRTEIDARLNKLLEAAFGPIWEILCQPTISEVYINEDGILFIKDLEKGKIKTDIYLAPHDSKLLIESVAGAVGEIINEDRPYLGCELYSLHCRFQAQIPPIVEHPTFTIRKKASIIFTFEEYIEAGFLTKEVADLLILAIKEHKNIVVTGGTGTGKTTFVNTLLYGIEQYTPHDRTIIIEDLPELQCHIEDCMKMQTKYSENKAANVDMNRLIWLCMRNTPKRIIVGEVRDGSAYDLLKSWNTGHPGGFGTTHANSALEGLDRLESLIYENDKAKGNFKTLLGQAIDYIVHITCEDFPNGPSKRYVQSLIQVHGYDRLTDTYETSVIYEKERR